VSTRSRSEGSDGAGGPRTGGFRPDIQGLRAVAVLLVALSHAGVHHLAGGYVGVDVFFVISGFLITGWILRHSERAGHVPFGQFYAARARRILPAAALTLVATSLTSFYLLNFIRAEAVFHDALWAAFFAANIHFAQIGTNYFSTSALPSPLQHYWSLAVEEQFYLVWPALVMLVLARPTTWRRGPKHAAGPFVSKTGVRRLVLVLGLCVVVSLIWSIRDTASNPTAAYFSTFARAWELGIGGLVALATPQLSRIPERSRALMTWVGLAGIFVAAVIFTSATAFPGFAALLPVLSAALIISGGLGRSMRGGASVVLGRQPLRFIGDVSYSFYLWHWPVLIIAAQYEGHDLSAITNLILLAGAFALSVVTYFAFERPIHHGRAFSNPWAGLSLWPVSIAAVVVTAAIGLNSVQAELKRNTFDPTSTTTTLPHKPGQPVVNPYIQAVAAAASPAGRNASVPQAVFAQINDFGARNYNTCITPVSDLTSSPICHLGAAHSSHVVVVYGDSHAQMWLGALNYFGMLENWQVIPLIKEGCVALEWSGHPNAPAPGDVLGAPSLRAARTASCVGWHEWARNELKLLHPDAIIFGTAYAWGANVGGSTARYNVLGLQKETDFLDGFAPKVVVMQDTPYWTSNPVDCLLASGKTVGDCTLDYRRALVALYSHVNAVVKAAGATVVPTVQWFCTATKCPPVIDNTIVYRDTEHVAADYATHLEDPLTVELAKALGPS